MWGFLLLLIILFFAIPAIKAYLAYRRLKNRFNEMFGGARETSRPGTRDGQHRRQPQRRRKKIDPSVGEYVEFEEITVSETNTTDTTGSGETTTRFTAESQIVDVEWEEIKP